jgi:hypothetical protein
MVLRPIVEGGNRSMIVLPAYLFSNYKGVATALAANEARRGRGCTSEDGFPLPAGS